MQKPIVEVYNHCGYINMPTYLRALSQYIRFVVDQAYLKKNFLELISDYLLT